jgi:23S rRNA (cytosine1962-C5)-methyltransferase
MAALARIRAGETRFDVVILDPPAFIKRKKDSGAGTLAYERLNRAAQEVLVPDGILVTCSCSFHMGSDEFVRTVQKSATRAGRHLQIIGFGGQAADHPVHPAMPETRYLKSLFCRSTPSL